MTLAIPHFSLFELEAVEEVVVILPFLFVTGMQDDNGVQLPVMDKVVTVIGIGLLAARLAGMYRNNPDDIPVFSEFLA